MQKSTAWTSFLKCSQLTIDQNITVDSRYLHFGYLELPLIWKRKSDPCFNIES